MVFFYFSAFCHSVFYYSTLLMITESFVFFAIWPFIIYKPFVIRFVIRSFVIRPLVTRFLFVCNFDIQSFINSTFFMII